MLHLCAIIFDIKGNCMYQVFRLLDVILTYGFFLDYIKNNTTSKGFNFLLKYMY